MDKRAAEVARSLAIPEETPLRRSVVLAVAAAFAMLFLGLMRIAPAYAAQGGGGYDQQAVLRYDDDDDDDAVLHLEEEGTNQDKTGITGKTGVTDGTYRTGVTGDTRKGTLTHGRDKTREDGDTPAPPHRDNTHR